MSSVANVAIHASQFPENVRRDLLESLRRRQVNHKFHYDSVKQTAKWLAVHEAFSPSRTDADCGRIYDCGFEAAAGRIKERQVQLIGLGCGGGQKDARLLRLLKARGQEVTYHPCDVSLAMVLVAREAVSRIVPEKRCFPFVFDLETAEDWPPLFREEQRSGATQLITFFGMIPNFEPDSILPRLARLVRRRDTLLFSANLAPGNNFTLGMRKILAQYDNPPTRDWLRTFLLDLGVEPRDGTVRFRIETVPAPVELKRVVADFRFSRKRTLEVYGETFTFRSGDALRLFFSYRYTCSRVHSLLNLHGLRVLDQWITASGEEGVFLCRRKF